MSNPNTIASEILQASAAGYAGYAASDLMARQKGIADMPASETFSSWKAHLAQRIMELAAALRVGEPEMFAARVRWTKRTFQARGMPEDMLKASLESLQHVLSEHLPGGASADACRLISEALDSWDADTTATVGAALSPANASGRAALRYLQQMMEGDTSAAINSILQRQRDGASLEQLYTEILLPALREVGRLWHIGDITIAEEHLVTAATERTMTLLTHEAKKNAWNGRTMVAATVNGNAHDVGLRATSDLFEVRGWRALYLGSDVPLRELASTLLYFDADLLLLSATLSTHIATVERSIAQVREHGERPVHIMVGGAAFDEVDLLWKKIGADSYAPTVDEAVRIGEEIFSANLN